MAQTHPVGEREALLAFVEEPKPTSSADPEQVTRVRSAIKSPLPEVDAYIHLLILVRLIDTEKLTDAAKCSQILITKLTSQNRRTLDLIGAKCYFYHSRVAELTNRLDSIRSFLHAR